MSAPLPPLLVQSYRADGVAPWIARCMASVQRWAARAGYQYEFVDDALFDLVPGWLRDRCAGQLLPLTDVARLLLIRERLRAGRSRVAWLDADVFVFAPERMALLNPPDGFAFCAEAWVEHSADGAITAARRVNNAAIVMKPDNPVLELYLHACLANARGRAPIGKLDFGPQLLTRLAQVFPLPTLTTVGMLSPLVAIDVARGGGAVAATFALAHGHPIAAANLCASLLDDRHAAIGFDAATVGRAMDVLEDSGGEIINRHLRAVPA